MLAAGLRFTGIGWGIQHYDASLAAATQNRTTFNSDEHNIVDLVAPMRPSQGDFRPRHWAWGTFHCYVVAGALGLAELAGVFPEPSWRDGLRAGRNQTVRRVYVVGRGVSAALGVASVLIVFLVARQLADGRAGLWAALALAVSPIHVLHSHFLTTDVALSFWLLLALLALVHGRFALGGLLIGIATAVKLPGVFFAPLPLLCAIRARARPWTTVLGLALGFLIAEPYALLAHAEWRSWFVGVVSGVAAPAAPVRLEIGPLLFYPLQLLLYGLGPAGLAYALLELRRADRRLLIAIAIAVVAIASTWITMTRYLVPLLVFLAIAVGVRLARWRGGAALLAGALFLVPPALQSAALVSLLRQPHTAQDAADWLARNVAEGSEIAQAWDVYPVLDATRWRVSRLVKPYGSGPFVAPTADVIVLDDLSLVPLRPELASYLHEHYHEAARFTRRPSLFGLALPEPYPAHDWKYTHPEIRVLRRAE